jgi:hypothetical protein
MRRACVYLTRSVPFGSGIDTPELGSHAKCVKERKLALIANGRLKGILREKGLKIEFYGVVDKTPLHRPLINICSDNGTEVGRTLSKASLGNEARNTKSTGAVRKLDRRPVETSGDRSSLSIGLSPGGKSPKAFLASPAAPTQSAFHQVKLTLLRQGFFLRDGEPVGRHGC